ncbi:hypothetical protein ACS0TY_008601 [Phlomoides rotata]
MQSKNLRATTPISREVKNWKLSSSPQQVRIPPTQSGRTKEPLRTSRNRKQSQLVIDLTEDEISTRRVKGPDLPMKHSSRRGQQFGKTS